MPASKKIAITDRGAYIESQVKKYQARNATLQSIIDKGEQFKTTATGYPALDFRTCSCKSYADRRKEHAEDCTVQAVTDPGPVISATKEMRMNDSYLDGLVAGIAPEDESAQYNEMMEWTRALAEENQRLRRELEWFKVTQQPTPELPVYGHEPNHKPL